MILVNAWAFMAMSILSASAFVALVLYLGHKIMHRRPKPEPPKSGIVVASPPAVFDELHRQEIDVINLHDVYVINGRSK